MNDEEFRREIYDYYGHTEIADGIIKFRGREKNANTEVSYGN